MIIYTRIYIDKESEPMRTAKDARNRKGGRIHEKNDCSAARGFAASFRLRCLGGRKGARYHPFLQLRFVRNRQGGLVEGYRRFLRGKESLGHGGMRYGGL